MITYAVSEFSYGGPREAFGLLDVEGQQTSFSEKDKHTISAHFFGQRPYPEIIIQLAPVQDSNQRNHDRPAAPFGAGKY